MCMVKCFKAKTSFTGTLRQLLRGRVRRGRGQVRRDRGDERMRQPWRPSRRQRLR